MFIYSRILKHEKKLIKEVIFKKFSIREGWYAANIGLFRFSFQSETLVLRLLFHTTNLLVLIQNVLFITCRKRADGGSIRWCRCMHGYIRPVLEHNPR